MATTATLIDIPAKYLFGFGLDQMKALQKAFAWYDRAPVVPTTYTASGAITVAFGNNIIAKTGSLAAMTLAAPTTAQNGTVMRITSSTAFAHTITATGLFDNGVTGGSKNTATFAAFPGASITVMAVGGKWNVLALQNVTVA